MPRLRLFKILFFLLAAIIALVWSTAGSPMLSSTSILSSPISVMIPSETGTPAKVSLLKATNQFTPDPEFTQTLQPTITSTPTPPTSHYISNIRGHHQYFPLGCEAAAAKDWANYFGKDFNEFEFQYKLPISDNPDFGFVGDVNSPWGQVPPYGYGVHAGPIADLLNQYGVRAAANKGYSLEQVRAKIAQDKPLIAWVIGNVIGGVPYLYTDASGNQTVVAAYEHVVIVTGYSESQIRYMNNGKFYDVPNQVFLNSWGVLGNMVVVDE